LLSAASSNYLQLTNKTKNSAKGFDRDFKTKEAVKAYEVAKKQKKKANIQSNKIKFYAIMTLITVVLKVIRINA
jgi:hypothetical protein